MKVRNYRELIVWQRAMDLVEAVYRVTASFPKEELYGLTGQVRRAAVSVPSNIAEGQGRRTTADFVHFLSITNGSLNEVETQIMVARRLGYISAPAEAEILELAAEVARLAYGLVKSLQNKSKS